MPSLVDGVTQKSLGAPCPILASAVRVDKAVGSLKQLITALPAYSDQLLAMVVKMLKEYKDNCVATYRGEYERMVSSWSSVILEEVCFNIFYLVIKFVE